MKLLKCAMGSLIGCAALLSSGAFADEQFDLMLPGITGTGTVAGIGDLIPIAEVANGNQSSFIVDRPVDGLSPALEQAVINDRLFSSATIYEFESAGTAPLQLYQTYTYSNVIAASHTLFDVGTVPYEQISFDYTGLVVSSVPEPDTVWLVLLGLAGLGLVVHRRKALVNLKTMLNIATLT